MSSMSRVSLDGNTDDVRDGVCVSVWQRYPCAWLTARSPVTPPPLAPPSPQATPRTAFSERLQRRQAGVDLRDLRGRVRRRVFLRRGGAQPPLARGFAAAAFSPAATSVRRRCTSRRTRPGEDATFPSRPASRPAPRPRAGAPADPTRGLRAAAAARGAGDGRRVVGARSSSHLCPPAPPGWRPPSPRARAGDAARPVRRPRRRRAARAVPEPRLPGALLGDVRGGVRRGGARGRARATARALARGRRGPKPRACGTRGVVGVGVSHGRTRGETRRDPRSRARAGPRHGRGRSADTAAGGGWRRAGEGVPPARGRLSRPSHCASRSLTLVRSSRSTSRRRAMSSRASSSRCFFASMRRRPPRRRRRRLQAPPLARRVIRRALRSTAPWLSARTSARRRSPARTRGRGVGGLSPRVSPSPCISVSVSVRAASRLSAASSPSAAFASSSPVAVAPRGRSRPRRL